MGKLSPREALNNGTVAEKLRNLFDSQNIRVDMETGRGIETLSVFSLNEQGEPQEHHPFSNWDIANDEQRKDMMKKLMDAAKTGDLMAFQAGEEQPVNVRIKEGKVSFSRNVGRKEPKQPGLFKRILHGINKSWFKEDFDSYEASRQRYERTQKKAAFYQKPEVRSFHQDQLRKSHERAVEAALNQERFQIEQSKVQQKLEQVYGDLSKAGVNNLITIDGKTLTFCMREEKERENLGKNIKGLKDTEMTEIRKKGYQRTAEFVTTALLMGKHVEMHVPNGLNSLADPPTILKAEELGLSKDDIVMRVANEKQNRMGLHENIDNAERFHRIEETRTLIGRKFGMDGFQRYSGFADPIRSQITNAWLDEHESILQKRDGNRLSRLPSEDHGMSMDRGCVGNHAIGMLMAEGKDLADILDPNKLVAEKADAGSRFLNAVMIKNPQTGKYHGDSEKMAEMNVTARLALKNYLDKALREVDLGNEADVYSDKFRVIVSAAHALFDLDQESAHLKEPIDQYLAKKYPGKEKEIKDGLSFAACGVGASVEMVAQSYRDMMECALGNPMNGMACANSVSVFAIGPKLTKMIRDNPDKDPTTLIKGTENMDIVSFRCSAIMGVSPTLKKASSLETGDKLVAFGRSALFGDIRKNVVFTETPTGTIVADIRQEREAVQKKAMQEKERVNVQEAAPQKAAPSQAVLQ